MRRVITYGTFDTLHHGHIRLLKRARNFGDYLIVSLSTDNFNQQKGKECFFDYNQRKEDLESLRCVDLVIPEVNWEQKIKDIKLYEIDIFVIGDDWSGKFDFLKEYCQVIYLNRTLHISSTKIKEIIKKGYEQ